MIESREVDENPASRTKIFERSRQLVRHYHPCSDSHRNGVTGWTATVPA